MSRPAPRDIEAIFREGVEIDRALERAARAVHREHKLLGIPLVIWRDGKVVKVPPEEIVILPEPTEPTEVGGRGREKDLVQ